MKSPDQIAEEIVLIFDSPKNEKSLRVLISENLISYAYDMNTEGVNAHSKNRNFIWNEALDKAIEIISKTCVGDAGVIYYLAANAAEKIRALKHCS